MSKQVYFKFKSCLTQYAIPFEGSNISCSDLKLAIRKKCAINFCDLTLLIKDNNKNIERVCTDNELIPAFSNVIVIRSPIATDLKSVRNHKTINPENFNKIDPYKNNTYNNGIGDFFKNINLATSDMTEEEKVDSVVESGFNNYCITGKRIPMGLPPASYKCNKCGIPGHWINACPGIPDKNGKLIDSRLVKRPSGIPVCRLTEVDENTPNSYLTPDGRYVVNIKNREAVLKGKKEKRPFSKEENPPFQKIEENIPKNLICTLCSKILTKPTKIPCCGTVFCETCIIDRLFVPSNDFDMHRCPNCRSMVNKLDSLKESDHHNFLVSEWLKERSTKKLEAEVKTEEKESKIKMEEIVKPPNEMTDDDLLNEILCMSNKENDIPDSSCVKKHDENVNLKSNDNLTREIFNQLLVDCQRSDIQNLVHSNQQVSQMIEGIVKQVLPNYLRRLETKDRSRSREKPTRSRHRIEYRHNNDYISVEKQRIRSKDSRDDYYRDRLERKEYFSENKPRRSDYIDVNNGSRYNNRCRKRSSKENSFQDEKVDDRNKSHSRRSSNQNEESYYKNDKRSKRDYSHDYQKEYSSKRESRYEDRNQKRCDEKYNKDKDYENGRGKYIDDKEKLCKYSPNVESNRNHRDLSKDKNKSSYISSRSRGKNNSPTSKRLRSLSNHEIFKDDNHIKKTEASKGSYNNLGSVHQREEAENCDKHRDQKRKYLENDEGYRSKNYESNKSNEDILDYINKDDQLNVNVYKYSSKYPQSAKDREKSPIRSKESLEPMDELSMDNSDHKHAKKDKSHKKSKKSKKNKSKHSDKKKHKKSKYLSD